MKLSAPIFRLKRVAKFLAREEKLPLNVALNRIAQKEGYNGWSHLAASEESQNRAQKVRGQLSTGDLLLLGARPGHGKTLLGLELAHNAIVNGIPSLFFTLEYNKVDVTQRMNEMGLRMHHRNLCLTVDTSDQICADYIIETMRKIDQPAFVVVDYLQLLDQNRSQPPLDQQVKALRNYANYSGSVIVIISQIDRAFETGNSTMPRLTDVRLPNQLDLTLFTKACFLHKGEIELSALA